jgi:DNA-directed RNA polymerase subunit E'/Rpb7
MATATAAAAAPSPNRGIYMKTMLSTRVLIPINNVGVEIKSFLERKVREMVEGKCIAEGFVRPESVSIISYSAGVIKRGNIEFTIVYDCLICHPVEGMLIEFIVKSITKAGIYGYIEDDKLGIKPMVVFVARDHHYANRDFSKIKEGDTITGKIFGVNFQLHDEHVYVIAELKPKPRIIGAKIQRGGGDAESDDSDDDDDDDKTL